MIAVKRTLKVNARPRKFNVNASPRKLGGHDTENKIIDPVPVDWEIWGDTILQLGNIPGAFRDRE